MHVRCCQSKYGRPKYKLILASWVCTSIQKTQTNDQLLLLQPIVLRTVGWL